MVMVCSMNKKNKGKRQATTLIKTAHRRLRILAAVTDRSIEETLDEIVFAGLKGARIQRRIMQETVRQNEGEE